jgi:hypothetical protein
VDDFIARLGEGAGSRELKNLWGRAEQAATDYGVSRSWDRNATLREWAVKSTTDIWRFAVANGDGTSNALDYLGCRNIGVCAPINEPYRIARDPILDLKTDPGVVRFMFDALRDFTGAILCKNVYWPAAAK